jgi:hypothetical protein
VSTIRQVLVPEEAQYLGSAFPAFDKINGTNFPVSRLLFDASADEAAFWQVEASAYGSGNWTVDLIWYAVNATTGVVRWGVSLAAVTPETDSQDVETKALATEQTVDDTHLGTTSKRLHKATVTISGASLDSVAAGDWVALRVRRIGSNAADTLANDAALAQVRLAYSST